MLLKTLPTTAELNKYMALNSEDKKDVSKAMGKAMANKVAKVTRDSSLRKKQIAESQIVPKDVRMKFLHGDRTGEPGAKSKVTRDGVDKDKRWGNSGIKGVGANSPAMMEARKGFAKSKAIKEKFR